MTPESARAWQRILRDLAIVVIAAFMLIHETLAANPNAYIIGAALAMFGIPAALRLDSRSRSDENGS